MFGCPLFAWMPIHLDAPTVCLDAPIYFDGSLYVWMPLVCFDAPIWLDTTHMFRCPLDAHMFRCTPCMFGSLPVCLDTPNIFGCPHTFGCIPCIFGCPHMLDTSCVFGHPSVCLDAPSCMFGCPHMFGYSPVCLATLCFEYPEYVWTLPYGWMPPCMFGRCLDACCTYTTQRKHALSD